MTGPCLTHLSHKADSSDVTRHSVTWSPDCQDACSWEWATGKRFTLLFTLSSDILVSLSTTCNGWNELEDFLCVPYSSFNFTEEFQMVSWLRIKISERYFTYFCPFLKAVLKLRGCKRVSRALSAEAVTGGIEETLNLLFHLPDHITWTIPFFPSQLCNNTWVEKR